MLILVVVIIILFTGVLLFMQQPQFGAKASGELLEKIKASPNYRDGKFQNVHLTPALKEGMNFFSVLWKFTFGKSKRSRPPVALPSVKTDLHALADNSLVWFGHSSYFIRLNGKNILVDPVLSDSASPIKFANRAFPGSNIYTADDFPVIDYLFITHDHWDHLDYETLRSLKPKIKKIITALGVSPHLRRWGFDMNCIFEKDWNEEIILEPPFIVNTLAARHFSGRGFKRNQSLWTSFAFTTPSMKLFLGGDSGYDTHFAAIGKKFGPFDIAILECGQYNEYWPYIHMMPEQAVQAALDLRAKKLLPVHWAKFSLSLHSWDEPILRVTEEAKKKNVKVITPIPGEAVDLKSTRAWEEWWKGN